MQETKPHIPFKVQKFSHEASYRVIELDGEKFDYGSKEAIEKLPTLEQLASRYSELGYSVNENPNYNGQTLFLKQAPKPSRRDILLDFLNKPQSEQNED